MSGAKSSSNSNERTYNLESSKVMKNYHSPELFIKDNKSTLIDKNIRHNKNKEILGENDTKHTTKYSHGVKLNQYVGNETQK